MSAIETAALVLAGIVQTFGLRVGTEQPAYTVLERAGEVEIRRYESRLAAEAVVAGGAMDARNEGFRKVAGYIFGDNAGKASIAMTAPVVQSAAPQKIAMTAPVVQAEAPGGDWRIQFIMPSKYTADSLPTPNDADVKIVTLPPQTYAVARFTGSRSGAAVDRRQAQLSRQVQGTGWRVAGEPTAWFYDPPWTIPFLRRNEVAMPVERAG